ncbi:MAG: ABC transporter ATP-binding protein [Paracoccaceae bacterium]
MTETSWTQHLTVSINRDVIAQVRRLVLENAVSEWKSFLASFLLLATVSAMTGFSAYLMKDVVNSVFIDRDQTAIVWVALAVGTVFIVKGQAAYTNMLIVVSLSMRIVATLQRKFYAQLLEQGMDYFTKAQAGGLMTRFNINANSARQVIEMVAMTLWRDLFSLLCLIAVMVIRNPTLSLVTLMIGPPAVLGVRYLMRRVKALALDEVAQASLILAVLKNTIDNIRIVKAYTLEDQRKVEMNKAIARVEDRVVKINRLSSLTVPLMETLGGLAIAAAILYGGFRVTSEGSDPGEFFSFVTAFIMAYEPARRLARFNVEFQRQMVGVGMFFEMIDKQGEDRPREGAPDLTVVSGDVSLEQVSFSYGANVPALTDISATFKPGTMTALVGPSGAGKTTIFAMLDRFYTPEEGRILIDGQDITEFSIDSVRRQIAVVTQDPQMFDGTIAENILLGRDGATEDEMIEAAKAANAHDFIIELPDGYDTNVGSAGGRLSGGQKQRISIARAIVRNAPILLLDEATSALDTLSEGVVQEALARLAKGRTTVAIAHRLSTIFDADQILVMDKGQIVERGRHKDLIEQEGLYQLLYRQQVERMQRGQSGETATQNEV